MVLLGEPNAGKKMRRHPHNQSHTLGLDLTKSDRCTQPSSRKNKGKKGIKNYRGTAPAELVKRESEKKDRGVAESQKTGELEGDIHWLETKICARPFVVRGGDESQKEDSFWQKSRGGGGLSVPRNSKTNFNSRVAGQQYCDGRVDAGSGGDLDQVFTKVRTACLSHCGSHHEQGGGRKKGGCAALVAGRILNEKKIKKGRRQRDCGGV